MVPAGSWGLYIARYCLQDESIVSVTSVLLIVPTIAVGALVPAMTKKIDKFMIGNEAHIEQLMPRCNEPWIVYMQVTERLFIELFDPQGAQNCCVPKNGDLNYQHLALIVEDIHAAREELASKGVPIDIEPNLGMDSTWQMWSHDPDGNKIEFMQYTDRSMQLIGRN